MTMGFNYLVLLITASFHAIYSNVTKDILFVLDSSESIGEFVFYGQIIPVVENFVRFHTLELDPLNTQVGMIAFGGRQQRYIPMNNNATKDKLINALGSISFHGGATGLHYALNHVLNDLLTPEYGDREDAENVLVLMTDGGTTNPLETFTAIDRLKAQGVTIYVVVAGCRFNWFNIHQMATNSSYIITDLHHNSPKFTAYHIWTDICKCQPPIQIVTAIPTTEPPRHHFYTGSLAHTAHLPCIDNDNFCELMPKENCVKYRDWAMGSCRKTCGLCPMVTIPMKSTTAPPKPTTITPKPTILTPKPTTATPKPTTVTPRYTITNNCFDVDPICSQFPSTQLCADKNWAFGSCRKTCGLCSETMPKHTTPKPTTTTPKPTTTTPKPTTTTPKPTTTTPKPTTTTPKPTTTTPKPTTTTPKPTTTTPKPTTTTPKPTTTTPKPTTTTPKPTTTTPKPTTTTPKPTTTTTKPTTTTPKPTTTTPKPTTTTPKPTTTTPKPTTTTLKPTTTTPKPTTTTHRPRFFTIRSIMKGKEEASL
eukprot:XP_011419570.1 PREDICTED: A-agglutinin anchorage subunit [Crassostrea gigas]